MSDRCEAHLGYQVQQQCGRKATHLATDDEGETFRLCGRCAQVFEGGMMSTRKLPEKEDDDAFRT